MTALIAIAIRIARSFCAGVNAGRYPAAGHEFMIVVHLRMRKIARTEMERDNERVKWNGRQKEKERACVCDDAEKNASDTHENKNDYVPRRGRTCTACHARIHVRTVSEEQRGCVMEWVEGGKRGIGVCRDAGPLPRCFVI